MRLTTALFSLVTLVTATAAVQAQTIGMVVNAYATYGGKVTPIPTKCGDAELTPVAPGSEITYEFAMVVDPGAAHPEGNMGLATIVFDVLRCDPASTDYVMNYMTAAETGYAELPDGSPGALRNFTNAMYIDSGSTGYPGYNGGWGWDSSGLPLGGDVTDSPGDILGAGMLAPLTWDADVNSTYPGNQPFAPLGIGHGTYTFPADDPACGGLQGGFGQDLSNSLGIVEGDGHWLMWRSTIDTSDWSEEDWNADYGWYISPTNGAVYSPTADYSQDHGGGFRIAVAAEDMVGDSFAFFLTPEPGTIGLMVLCGAAGIRRR